MLVRIVVTLFIFYPLASMGDGPKIFQRVAWLKDFEQLKQHISKVYANLEDKIQVGVIDPFQLNQATIKQLKGSQSDKQATQAIQYFIDSFHDGHFHVADLPRSSPPKRDLTYQTSAESACSSMNITERNREFSFEFNKIPEFATVENVSYKAGVWSKKNGSRIGFVRFHAFGEYGYRQVCLEEWEKFRTTLKDSCNSDCQWQFQYRQMVPRLMADARKLITEFNHLGVQNVVIDVTGNGGGGDWVDGIARLLAPKPGLQCQVLRRIRHPSTLASYKEMLTEVNFDLKNPLVSKVDRVLLQTAKKRLLVLIKQNQTTCDLSGVWNSSNFTPQCSLLSKSHEYACGLFAYLPPGSLAHCSSKQALFKSLDQPYDESLFKGRLFVVIDRNTSSSAEYFVSMLRDANVATVIGEHSHSTGCGYINGGVPLTLNHSGLRVKVPTCARFRKDGQNEVFGIEPDIKIPWVNKSPEEATRRLLEVIQKS